MHKAKIEIFTLAQTRLNEDELRKWLDRCGATETPLPGPEVTDAGALSSVMGKRCYLSFEPGLNPNVTRVRKAWHDHISNLIASKHGSVLEHASWTFAIEGASRVCEVELVRHRVGTAFSIQSGRYVRYDNIPYWEPHSIQEGNLSLIGKCPKCKGPSCDRCSGAGTYFDPEDLAIKQRETRSIFEGMFVLAEMRYQALCGIWGISEMKDFNLKKRLTSMFRRVVPQGHSTGIGVTFNTRSLRHVLAMRTDPSAEEEIAHVLSLIGKRMLETETSLFGDFTLDPETGAYVPGVWKV